MTTEPTHLRDRECPSPRHPRTWRHDLHKDVNGGAKCVACGGRWDSRMNMIPAIPAPPEQGGPLRPRDIGYRVRVDFAGRTETAYNFHVTATQTPRLAVALYVVPHITRALAWALRVAMWLFPAGVRPTVSVTVNLDKDAP